MDIKLGRELFMFDSFSNWYDTAVDKFAAANVSSKKVVCLDRFGRVCLWDTHFMIADKDGAYPVRVYMLRDDMEKTDNIKLSSWS